jgi:REP element-mobilizing transposase RayT
LRIEASGLVVHVTARGNERRPIVFDDEDRSACVRLLGAVASRYGWSVLAYCLMTNHYHVLVELSRGELVRGVRQLNGVFAQSVNRRHARVGHLFQGRYRAVLVERDGHLLEAVRYVLLNPVRARMCEHPADYRWSSYQPTVSAEKSDVVARERLLSLFGAERPAAVDAFERFVLEGIEQVLRPELRGQIYLGSERFAAETAGLAPAVDRVEVARVQYEPVRPNLALLLAEHGELGLLIAYRQHRYRLRELADALGCHYSTISRRIARLERQETLVAKEPA